MHLDAILDERYASGTMKLDHLVAWLRANTRRI